MTRLRFVALGLLAGCSSGSATDADLCTTETAVGFFQINAMDSTNASPDFQGYVRERSVLQALWRTIDSDASCVLSELESAISCNSCAPGDVCAYDGTCVHAPERSVGTVELTGWSSSPRSFEPIVTELSVTYSSDAILLDPNVTPLGPGPAPGTELTLDASGGDYTPFHLTAHMISPLAFRSDAAATASRGQPLTLEWEPPDQLGQSHIFAIVNGGAGTTTCSFPDTGRGVVAARLLPSIVGDPIDGASYGVLLHRFSGSSTTIAPGCVSFSVHSQADQSFAVEN